MSVAQRFRVGRLRPTRGELAWGALLVNAELIAVLAYLVGSDAIITRPLLLVVPFVWINVGLWAIVRTRPVASGRRQRLLAGAVGVGYFLVLAYVGGLVGPGAGTGGLSISVASVPPGWGPVVSYQSPLLGVTILPYKLVGYLTLSYLVYAVALEASNALVGGVVGLFSCVSCTFPVVAAIFSGVAGSGSALAAFAYGNSYLLSTLVFLVTVGLLRWRPVPRWRANS